MEMPMSPDQIPWLTVSTALVLALILPVILLVIRHTVRRASAEIITELEQVFELGDSRIGSFEFAKSKYSGHDKFSWWKLYLAAIPFMVISFFGLSLAFIPLSQGALLKQSLTFHTLVASTLLTSG